MKRTYSQYTTDAAKLLGQLIQLRRKKIRMTAASLAERVGISRGTLRRIEQGDLNTELGLVFEAAVIVGLTLFNSDEISLRERLQHTEEVLTLLPTRIKAVPRKVDDNF